METQNNHDSAKENFYDVYGSSWDYAGFWVRVGATFIDSILLSFLTTPLLILFYGTDYFANPSEDLVRGF